MKNTSLKNIKTTKRQVYLYWLKFLRPYHHLAPREMEALSTLLYYRQELSNQIDNEELVEKLLFSQEIRRKVKADLGGMDNGVFNNLLTALRTKKVLTKENKIIRPLIPRMEKDANAFNLIFNFEFADEEK